MNKTMENKVVTEEDKKERRRLYMNEYNNKPETKARKTELMRGYRKTEKHKLYLQEYQKSESYKISVKRYKTSQLGRSTTNKQELKPDRKEYKKTVSVVGKLRVSGYHTHHWSYLEEHKLDIIYLTPKDHAKAHRLITKDRISKMYVVKNSGVPLDTKEKHIHFLISQSIIPAVF